MTESNLSRVSQSFVRVRESGIQKAVDAVVHVVIHIIVGPEMLYFNQMEPQDSILVFQRTISFYILDDICSLFCGAL